MQVYFKYFAPFPRSWNFPRTGKLASIWYTCTNGQLQQSARTDAEIHPNGWPNDSAKVVERFRSNDSVTTPERLFTSKRTNMLQVLFIIGCLLVPAFNDWTEKCRKNN